MIPGNASSNLALHIRVSLAPSLVNGDDLDRSVSDWHQALPQVLPMRRFRWMRLLPHPPPYSDLI